MLAVTTDAVQAIQDLVADHPGAGLRIASRYSDGDQLELGLSVSEQPSPTDAVVEEEGCQVFVAEDVVSLLDGRTLDAHVTPDQKVAFTLQP
jgi:Fe-S cluster assembly iron-binding protein IscA